MNAHDLVAACIVCIHRTEHFIWETNRNGMKTLFPFQCNLFSSWLCFVEVVLMEGENGGWGEAICLRLILSLYINWLLASLYGRFSSDCVTFTHFDSTKHKYTITSSGKFKAIHPIHEISYRSSFGVPLFFAQLAFDCMWLDSLTIISFDK